MFNTLVEYVELIDQLNMFTMCIYIITCDLILRKYNKFRFVLLYIYIYILSVAIKNMYMYIYIYQTVCALHNYNEFYTDLKQYV